ncbi:MAG: heme-binding protein [Firmicutes bacterium]|nr:heme-binding protein [Bacillota bacterium]
MPGGLSIKSGGRLIGEVGVSGGTPAEDVLV